MCLCSRDILLINLIPQSVPRRNLPINGLEYPPLVQLRFLGDGQTVRVAARDAFVLSEVKRGGGGSDVNGTSQSTW